MEGLNVRARHQFAGNSWAGTVGKVERSSREGRVPLGGGEQRPAVSENIGTKV